MAADDATYAARPQGGDTRSRRIEAHREKVLALHEARRDIIIGNRPSDTAASTDPT